MYDYAGSNQAEFDLMIVYNGNIAGKADDSHNTLNEPFSGSRGAYNAAYQYFLSQAKKEGLTAAFTTTDNIIGPGQFNGYWTYEHTWKRHQSKAVSFHIFDKFSPIKASKRKGYEMLMRDGNVSLFHNGDLRALLEDKLKTYEAFPDEAIPSVAIDLQDAADIQRAKKELVTLTSQPTYANCFKKEFVLKDRLGAGGMNIFRVNSEVDVDEIPHKEKKGNYLIQPFIDTSGMKIKGQQGLIDLRVILFNGEIIQSYIRIAKKGEYRANTSLGGDINYLQPHEIPKDILEMVTRLNGQLPTNSGVYTFDFIKSANGRLFFIEGNSSPGLHWTTSADEIFCKQMMDMIIESMGEKIGLDKQRVALMVSPMTPTLLEQENRI